MSAGSDVAASLTQDILGEAAGRGFATGDGDEAPEGGQSAKQVASELLRSDPVSDESAAAEEAPHAAAEPEDEVEDTFDLSAFKPVGEDADEEDEDAEATFDLPAAVVTEDDDEDESDEYVDPEVRQLRAQVKARRSSLSTRRACGSRPHRRTGGRS
jgi:hypothetical protein